MLQAEAIGWIEGVPRTTARGGRSQSERLSCVFSFCDCGLPLLRRTPMAARRRERVRDLIACCSLLLAWLCKAQALVQQVQVIARCLEWTNGTCEFADTVTFERLNLTQQTLCKVRRRFELRLSLVGSFLG